MTGAADPRTTRSAGGLLVARAQLLLERRLAFLAQINGSGDDPRAEAAFHARRDGAALDAIDRLLQGSAGAAWARLVTLLGLDAGEAGMLSLCAAVALEPSLAPLIAQAQSSTQTFAPTEPLVRRLFGLSEAPVIRTNSRLRFWRLVAETQRFAGEPAGYRVDPVVPDWLTGHLAIDADLAYFVRHHKPAAALPGWPVQATARRIGAILETGRAVAVQVAGHEGSGRQDFAAHVAARLGYGAIAHRMLDGDLDLRVRLERFALFSQAAVIGPPPDDWPDGLPPAPLHFIPLSDARDTVIVGGATPLRVQLPQPSVDELRATWRETGADDDTWSPALEFARLRDVRALAATCPGSETDTAQDFATLCRARLGEVGRPVEPAYSWEDLVLPEALREGLRAFAFEARHRRDALANPEMRRLFATASGLTAMFSGPSGTGKTMAAQIIAADLGVPLLRVDLAAVSSKFVGDTAKNLSRAFREVRNAAAALFFDEADALFAKRTDGQDTTGRYANADTGHLLQLLEGHDGVVILSTNRRGAIDPAFVRRLRHIFEFPRPDAALRAQICRKLLLAMGEDPERLETRMADLVQRAEISPSQIKSAMLTARYAALKTCSPIDIPMIEDAIAQEYAKEGRTTTRPRDRRSRR
ncbi:ATP-binding protein [Roseovarius sp. D22-M7]|uniref:ATP-binding protein n=1 Tax=Roseovarius sp. D22-M7 TaxID=3127116 RepID=UPI00300F98C8